MDAQGRLLTEHTDYIYERINGEVFGLSEDEATWTPCQGSNTMMWILTHMARIGLILIPQAIHGTVKPGGWDDDYQERPHTLEEVLRDLRKAYTVIKEGIAETGDEELAEPLTLWGRQTDRKGLLFHLLAELIHHNGQIAMLRGIYKRSGLRD
ncbi:DUF664 domain-containing protein [Candidatus Bathyarchaeota archaeon]|nr:DUF664 domain-containing protein [Candidatus Bathyarchaeota archaeon]